MEKLLFCLPTSRFLVNPAPESSELAAVEAPEQFEAEKLLFCLPTSRFLLNPAPEPSWGEGHARTCTDMRTYGQT